MQIGKLFLMVSMLSLISPSFALAAYNDVTLTSSANISVGGYTLNITGSNSVIQSIIINTSSFDVTLASGSSLVVSSSASAGFNMSALAAGVTATVTCPAPSALTLTSTALATVTITPAVSCMPYPSRVLPGSANHSRGSSPVIAKSATVADLQAQLSAMQGGSSSSYTFSTDLKVGSKGADVTALQNWLIKKGQSIPAGATGYFGAQTKAAVSAWQAAAGISPAVGYFGQKSRAAANVVAAGISPAAPKLKEATTRNSAEISKLQNLLISKDFLKIPTDTVLGTFGPLTKKALANWQKSVGIIPATGDFGPKTKAFIKNLK